MKVMRRVLSAALSALLLGGVLSGCTDQKSGPSPTGGVELVETPDMVEKLLGYPRDTTLVTVNGTEVLAEDFLYHLNYAIENAGYLLYGDPSKIDWAGEIEGVPAKTYFMDSAMENVQFYALIRSKAAENGVTITAETQKEMDEMLTSAIETLGGVESYAKRLQTLGISDEGFRRITEINYLYAGLREKLYGRDSENAPTEEQLCQFAETTADALLAKHILIKTVDDGFQPLPEEEQAAAKAKAEDLLAQIRASEKPMETFDALMNEHSQDGRDPQGNLGAPDGYLFTANQMVPEFEAATRALEYNQISDLVKSDYGYHIILRLPPANDEVRGVWEEDMMSKQVEEWMAECKVETTEQFSQIDPQTYYEKLSAMQQELNPAPTPDATPAPDEGGQEPQPTPTPVG